MEFIHCIVWIDHLKAHVIRFDSDRSENHEVRAHGATPHLHHKHGAVGSGHAPENHKFYDAVANAIRNSQKILVTGPASAKLELVKHIESRHRDLVRHIVGVESSDHPTVAELLAHGRKHFDLKSATDAAYADKHH